MCLTIEKYAFKRLALTNVVVYKHLKKGADLNDLFTPYRYSTVCIGETYKSDLFRRSSCRNYVDFGLHSFKTLDEAIADGIYEGSDVVVKCIIPRGSRYYVGKFFSKTSLASTRIKYLEIVENLKQ